MRKQWMTWALVVVVLAAPLLLMGVKCNPNNPEATLEEEAQQQEQQNQGTPVTFTKESLEKAGVPVYPSTEDAIEQDVTKDGAGSFHGTVFLVSSTCPPENVQRFYDSTLRDMPGYSKEIIEGSAHYKFILENGDQVTMIITSAGEGPTAGSNITTIFN